MFPEPENDWPEMFGIIQKCCAFQPKERYQTATEIKSDLEKLQKTIGQNEKRREFLEIFSKKYGLEKEE